MRLRDNRRMTDAAHNQHSETRRPSDRDRIDFSGSPNRHRHHLSATLLDGRAGNGWARLLRYGREIARAAGFRMLVMSRIRHAAIVP